MPMTDWPQPDLNQTVAVGPGVDLESWRLTVPAKPGCYLLTDEAGTPVLLGTAANMRNVLVHRLTAPPDDDEPTRRIDYRQVVRKVHFRPAFSRFETDWSYIANARQFYPQQAARLTRKWTGNWVHIDLADAFPRFAANRRPDDSGEYFGPLPTANAARLFVETATDLFDLCRYHDILRQTPDGQACAYKEMGKCPAPCDGTVTFENYRGQLRAAHGMLHDPKSWLTDAERRMAEASGKLAFERAARIKSQIEQASRLVDSKYGAFAPMAEHRYLLVLPGTRKHHARLFVGRPDGVTFLGEIVKRHREDQVAWLSERVEPMLAQPLGTPRADAGLLSWYLLRGEKETGIWLPYPSIGPDQITSAIEALSQKGQPLAADEQDTDSDSDDGQDEE